MDKIDFDYLIVNYKKMFPFVKPHLLRAILGIAVTIPVGAMDGAIAWIMKPYMDTVLIAKEGTLLSWIPVLIVGFSLVQSSLTYAANYLNTWVANRIALDLKTALFKRLIRYESAFFDTNSSGNIQFRFNQDADMACAGVISNVKVFTTQIFSSLGLIFVLFYNSWQLAIIAVLVMVFALYPLTSLRRRLRELMNQTVLGVSQLVTYYNEAFNGNRTITSYNLYAMQESRFAATLRSIFKLSMKMVKRTGILSPMMHFIISWGIAGAIWVGSYLITSGKLTPGEFVSFITALMLLYRPIKAMGNNVGKVQLALMSMERVFEMLDAHPHIVDATDAVALTSVAKDIRYKDVSFEYVAGKPVLKEVNLTIPVGSMVAFVGNSGGGKTTLANLLPRFYDVTRGSIEIDGVDIRQFTLESLRDKIAVVFQDNFLFAGTIRENILLGNPLATEEQLARAVSSACLDDFIQSLDRGLDTEIGERGILLSGGQKQRVAIARAFVKNAPIVILDEATSALDNQSEQVVQQAINNLMIKRTVLIIAHRLSTIRNADKIVVVNHGRIVEEGSHDALIAQERSVYRGLYQISGA